MKEFSYMEQKRIVEYNGFSFLRRVNGGSHEVWGRRGVEIVLVNGGNKEHSTKICTFWRIVRENKMVLIDKRGRKVY